MILTFLFLLLFSNGLTVRPDTSILYSRISILIVFYGFISTLTSFYITLLDKGISLYGGLFSVTSVTHTFQMIILLICGLILLLTGFYPRKLLSNDYMSFNKLVFTKLQFVKNIAVSNIILKKGEQYTIIEYTLMLLFIMTGSILLISSSDLVSIFLAIELQSYGLYLLCAMYRNSESATSAGLTYFLLGGLSSCFILLGIALIYANLGVTSLDSFYVINNLAGILNGQEITTYIPYCLLLISIGFLFKISAAPFHFWSPDVYDAIPTVVTTFVAIIAKISIFIFLLELVYNTNNNIFEFNWTNSLILSSILSLIIGSVLGLTQYRIKRLYAYSTISHVGFLLLALCINNIESIQAFIFYLIQYSFSNLGAFIILISIGYALMSNISKNEQIKNLKDRNNSPIQLISQLKGLFSINPLLAISLSIVIFSFLGAPPLMGFFGKQMVLGASLDKGYVFMTLVGILTSVISGVYYLAINKNIFFDESVYSTDKEEIETKSLISLSSSITIIISIITILITTFMFIPSINLYLFNFLMI